MNSYSCEDLTRIFFDYGEEKWSKRIAEFIINERQKNTETVKQQISKESQLDDLVKLKSMLDSGIITQEEFDAKKKQLLGF